MHVSFQISIFIYFSDIYLGMQEEKGVTEDKMVGWHHQLDGHEFGQTMEGWHAVVHGVAKSWTPLSN